MKKLFLFISILLFSLNSFSQELAILRQLGWDEKIKQADKFVKKKIFKMLLTYALIF